MLKKVKEECGLVRRAWKGHMEITMRVATSHKRNFKTTSVTGNEVARNLRIACSRV